MTEKPREAKTLQLRQARIGDPAELVITDDGFEACVVYRLRLSQLRQLAYDAVRMALKC